MSKQAIESLVNVAWCAKESLELLEDKDVVDSLRGQGIAQQNIDELKAILRDTRDRAINLLLCNTPRQTDGPTDK